MKMTNIKDDWRRQGQECYLSGVKLFFRDYHPYSSEWDHDHCEFCGAKFSLKNDNLKQGYSTEDGYHWVCNQCFHDFLNEFKWCTCPESLNDAKNADLKSENGYACPEDLVDVKTTELKRENGRTCPESLNDAKKAKLKGENVNH